MKHRETNFLKGITFVLTVLVSVFFSANCCRALEIMNYRYWTAPDHTRIVLDVNGKPDYKIRESEDKLVLSLPDSSINNNIKSRIVLNQPGIKKIHFQHVNEKDVRIDFFLDKHQKIEVFKLRKFQDKPDRIVVDILFEEVQKEEKLKPKASARKKKKVIVIDPGHGGDDPGAIGKKGSYEKNIVLAISREIRDIINTMPGYRAVLTRDGDYYVSFSKRLQKARDLQASLFISIHADAARSREAKGSSVYCLSTGAASNEAAKLLAHNENLSDIFGGETDIEGSNESNPIIMNMFQTNTINLSKIYAEILIKHLDTINCLKYGIVQEAPFRVLKLPDIPAVLIETAYISNPHEEKLLKKNDFQKSLATAISSSLQDYFTDTEGTVIAADDEINVTRHKIKKGDTLFTIAGKYKTHVSVLLKLNNIKLDDTLLIGQDIMVPADKPAIADKHEGTKKKLPEKADKPAKREKPAKYYTVKKGETLFIVAQKHSTTLQELLKINNMKMTDPLLFGQKIKIP